MSTDGVSPKPFTPMQSIAYSWHQIESHFGEKDPKFYGILGRMRKCKGRDKVEQALEQVLAGAVTGQISCLGHAKASVLTRLATPPKKSVPTVTPTAKPVPSIQPVIDWAKLDKEYEEQKKLGEGPLLQPLFGPPDPATTALSAKEPTSH